jgi:hypothetical protein
MWTLAKVNAKENILIIKMAAPVPHVVLPAGWARAINDSN